MVAILDFAWFAAIYDFVKVRPDNVDCFASKPFIIQIYMQNKQK